MPERHKNKSEKLSSLAFAAFEKRIKKENDQFKRKLFFIGYLFEKLREQGVTTYLVGGQAIELYTGGQFTTGDIDITSTDRKTTIATLESMKFKKTGMIWLREDFGIAVQIVSSYPSSTEKSRSLDIAGANVNVIGVEDLVINRLASAKFWRSNPKLDMEQAKVLSSEFRDSLDMEYLRKLASENHVTDFLASIIKTAKKRRSR